MLEYRLNNEPLWIDEGTSVVIENYNPACFFDSLQNCSADGVEIPVNSRNRALLGNPERFQRYEKSRKYTGFEIKWKGALLVSGTLELTFDGDKYTGWVQSALGAMGEAQQEKNITQMGWPVGQVFAEKDSYDDDNDDYGLEVVVNPNFWDDKGAQIKADVEFTDSNGVQQTFQAYNSVLGEAFYRRYRSKINDYDAIYNGCVISPYLYLRYVHKEAFRLQGFYIGRNDMENDYANSYLKNVKIYNNFNILDINIQTNIASLFQYDPDTREVTEETFDVVDHNYSNFYLNQFRYADLLPAITYKEYLLGIQNSQNYIHHFIGRNTVNIIDRNQILNTVAIDLSEYRRGEWIIGTQKNVYLKFTPEYDKDDNMFKDYEDLTERRDDFGEPVTHAYDLDDIVGEFGELRLVKTTNAIYEYKWKVIDVSDANSITEQVDVLGWEKIATGPQPYIYNGEAEEEEEIKTAISPVMLNSVFYPQVKQKGNLGKMRNAQSGFGFRLLDRDWNARSMYWEGENGLFNQRWKNWAAFWSTRLEVTAKFQLPLNMHTYLQNNITNKLRTREGEFIIETMSTEFGMHEIGETTIKGYKV